MKPAMRGSKKGGAAWFGRKILVSERLGILRLGSAHDKHAQGRTPVLCG